jgi:hypothetical protein
MYAIGHGSLEVGTHNVNKRRGEDSIRLTVFGFPLQVAGILGAIKRKILRARKKAL